MPSTVGYGLLAGHGLRVQLPDGWSGRIFRYQPDPPETSGPTLHAGNFAIPVDPANRGTGLVQSVTSGRVAVIYNEAIPDHAIQPNRDAYAGDGVPIIRAADLAESHVLGGVPGQVGAQYFFTTRARRPGVLAVVIGGSRDVNGLIADANDMIDGLQFASAPEGSDFSTVPRQEGR